jgi:hypothetical protein
MWRKTSCRPVLCPHPLEGAEELLAALSRQGGGLGVVLDVGDRGYVSRLLVEFPRFARLLLAAGAQASVTVIL